VSLAVAVKGPEGIAFATDSRLVYRRPGDSSSYYYSTVDSAQKLLAFPEPHRQVGAVVYGFGSGAFSTNASAFELELPGERLRVRDYAERLAAFYSRQAVMNSPQPYAMYAFVGGFDPGEDRGRVFSVEVPDHPEPVEQHAGGSGISYGGQREFVDRLLVGYDARLRDFLEGVEGLDSVQMQIPLATMNLGACADLAGFLVRMTRETQTFIAGLQGVGGGVYVATVTAADGVRWVARPEREAQTQGVWRQTQEIEAAMIVAPACGIRPAGYTATLAEAQAVE